MYLWSMMSLVLFCVLSVTCSAKVSVTYWGNDLSPLWCYNATVSDLSDGQTFVSASVSYQLKFQMNQKRLSLFQLMAIKEVSVRMPQLSNDEILIQLILKKIVIIRVLSWIHYWLSNQGAMFFHVNSTYNVNYSGLF